MKFTKNYYDEPILPRARLSNIISIFEFYPMVTFILSVTINVEVILEL